MFNISSINSLTGESCKEEIPAARFEVSGPAIYKFAVITAISAVIVAAIGASLMITQPVGSNAFWIGTAESLFGISALIIAAVDYHLTQRENQTRMLHHCTNLEEYKALLATDQGVNYAFKIPGFAKNYIQTNKAVGANLEGQLKLDTERQIYCIDGEPIEAQAGESLIERIAHEYLTLGKPRHDDQSIHPKDTGLYANQSILVEIMTTIRSRYECADITLVVERDVTPKQKEKNTRFNLLSEGNVLEVEQLVGIKDYSGDLPFKYLTGKLRLDFRTGDAVLTWSSPQDERPSF